MYSYIEARAKGVTIVPFGLQMFLKKYLSVPFTLGNINEAEDFAFAHGLPFDRDPWGYILETYQGYFPVTIWTADEGTPIPSQNAIVTIACTDPKVFWLASYIETMLLRAIWYPTTIASQDFSIKNIMKRFYDDTGAAMEALPFALHDFGGRGVTSHEQAEIGGAAHLVNFNGSDTIEGIRAANYYYVHPMAAFSVPATEHSVECSYGSSNEAETTYLEHILDTFAKPGKIVSIVIDGYDVFRAVHTLCTTLKDKIISSGAKVVFRPDSGNPLKILPRILQMQELAFGFDLTDKGFKKIRNVGLLQGDGIDHEMIKEILTMMQRLGYSADNIVFGSGGSLLQKVNRDTFAFAQKASAIVKDGVLTNIAKNPITDPGKKSKEGIPTLYRSRLTGEYITLPGQAANSEFELMMHLVYKNGALHNETTLDEIRARAVI